MGSPAASVTGELERGAGLCVAGEAEDWVGEKSGSVDAVGHVRGRVVSTARVESHHISCAGG